MKDFAERCFAWQAPTNMRSMVKEREASLAGPWRNLAREWREAFVASLFAIHRKADGVKLLREGASPTPDFAIRFGERELLYETTIVDRADRRPGAEPEIVEFTLVPEHERIWSKDYAEVVRQKTESKACKAYGSCDGLIIHDNALFVEDKERLSLEWWRENTVKARDAFAEVWWFDSNKFRCL